MPNPRVPDPPKPDWSPEKTLLQIRQQLGALEQFKRRKYGEVQTQHSEWVQQTMMILRHGFGEQHQNYRNFNFTGWAAGEYHRYESEDTKEQLNFEARVTKEESCLNTCIKELELTLPEKLSRQEATSPSLDARSQVLLLCRRFHRYVTALANRSRGKPPLVVDDEYDVQYLMNALLRVHFNDVRSEEGTVSYAGGGVRMDFLLKAEQLVVEAKMTRPTLKDREIGDELLQDIARYKQHPDCEGLICLIYDPSNLLTNPHGLQSDLERMSSDGFFVAAVIVPER